MNRRGRLGSPRQVSRQREPARENDRRRRAEGHSSQPSWIQRNGVSVTSGATGALALPAALMRAPQATFPTERETSRFLRDVERARAHLRRAFARACGAGVPERGRRETAELFALADICRLGERSTQLLAPVVARQVERCAHARLVGERQCARQRFEHRTRRGGVSPSHPKKKRRVAVRARTIGQSRDELERWPRRRWRRTGRTPRRRVGLRKRPSNEGPRRTRARWARRDARACVVERAHVSRLDGHFGEHQPATEMALGASKDGQRRPYLDRDGHRTKQRHEELDAHRDAVALLDHRSELREKRSVRLVTSHARELRPEREVRLTARGNLREKRRKIRIAREARRTERRRAARLVSCERLPEQRHRLAILRLRQRAEPAGVQLTLARTTPHQHGRRFA